MKPHRTNSAQGSFLLPDLARQLTPAKRCIAWQWLSTGHLLKVPVDLFRAQRARKATRRLKTIARRVVRQLDKGLDANAADRRWLEVAKRVLKQKRGDRQKVYSLHEPEVYCLSKGKEHKKYEFGAKASLVVGKTHGVILGAYSLRENGL